MRARRPARPSRVPLCIDRQLRPAKCSRNSYFVIPPRPIDAAGVNSEQLDAYLRRAFPLANLDSPYPIEFGTSYLRFELGEPHDNGSLARVEQSVGRALELFGECFQVGTPIAIVVNDWSEEFLAHEGPAPYLHQLLGEAVHGLSLTRTIDLPDGDGALRQIWVTADLGTFDHQGILRGIAHREQGRIPRVNEDVFFVHLQQPIAFHMYDDRGCRIFSDMPGVLEGLAHRYEAWLVPPWSPPA